MGTFKEIEGNLILNSKIIIRILEPISTKKLLEPLYSKGLLQEEILNSLRYDVTHDFMNKIYESLTISFDHIFTLILFLFPKEEIELEYFKRLIYIVFSKIKEKDLPYDESINKDLIYLISYEKFEAFDDILKDKKSADDDDMLVDDPSKKSQEPLDDDELIVDPKDDDNDEPIKPVDPKTKDTQISDIDEFEPEIAKYVSEKLSDKIGEDLGEF